MKSESKKIMLLSGLSRDVEVSVNGRKITLHANSVTQMSCENPETKIRLICGRFFWRRCMLVEYSNDFIVVSNSVRSLSILIIFVCVSILNSVICEYGFFGVGCLLVVSSVLIFICFDWVTVKNYSMPAELRRGQARMAKTGAQALSESNPQFPSPDSGYTRPSPNVSLNTSDFGHRPRFKKM